MLRRRVPRRVQLLLVRLLPNTASLWPSACYLCFRMRTSDDCMQFVGWRAQLGAVVMPCCNWYLGARGCGMPLHQEDDLGVISPHRQVSVWKWAPGDALPPAVPPPDAPPDVLEGETPY